MFKVYYSNQLEQLLDGLAEVTAEPLSHPLMPEVIVTQSQGMARWLALGLAEHRSIAANIDFVLPATFIWRVLASHLGAAATSPVFDREVLSWRLMNLVPRFIEQPAFAPLERYLRGEHVELKRYQLARRIADVFDQYLIYRPDLIMRWEEGAQEDDWQAQLWRALADGEGLHRARLMTEFLNDRLALDTARLPERLCIFGIPTLPPAYLDVIAKLASATEVHLFALNPCLEFWGDIENPRRIARLRQRRARLGKPLAEDHLTSGNSLLASLGKQGRDFIDAVQGHAAEEVEYFAMPEGIGMLGRLQSDMLLLQEGGRDTEPLSIEPGDDSVQVHLCHSPLREVEVLHDQLLAHFEADPTLRPQDVVVMTPDIEQYAPYIEAVFGGAPEARHIPWTIADLSRQSEHPVVQAFLQLLALPEARFTATEVLSLLEIPAVLRRFRFEFSDFENIRRWVRESGVRWGLDAQARKERDLPELENNTWAFGFRRLFLGYAMAPGEERLFEGVLPYVHVEGQDVEVLGRLRTFLEQLASFARRLRRPKTAEQWAALINELLEAFFEPDGDDSEPLQIIRDAAATLVSETEKATFDEPFGIEVLRDYLRGPLADTSTEQRFLSGSLTFCAMIPMRSLPFRVIALIGLNDGAFPRQQRPLGFDRMAEKPRRGDRSRREDDRYLFLEALISAREKFYISYVGRNIRDNTPMLPSVLVAELLDYIDQAFVGEGMSAREHVVTEHPLQPFSERYFSAEASLFSYAKEWLPAARQRGEERQEIAPFCAQPLPSIGEPEGAIELSVLCRFFRHPARAFLRERLGVWLGDDQEVLDDNEPFALNGLERYGLHNGLLEHLLAGEESATYRTLVKARGDLPSSGFADLLLEAEVGQVEELAEAIRPHLAGVLPDLEVELRGSDWQLTGWLERLTEGGLIRYRVGTIKAKDRLNLWIQHLVLNALSPARCSPVSRLIGGDGEVVLAPVEEAREHLETLVRLYRQGRLEPLRLMPNTSFAYAQALARDVDPMGAARKAWESNPPYQKGEDDDADFAVAFRGCDPLEPPFGEIAEAVFLPLLDAQQRGEKL